MGWFWSDKKQPEQPEPQQTVSFFSNLDFADL